MPSIAGWLAAAAAGCAIAAGCATERPRVEYIPADRAIAALRKGDPAPNDGWYVPPAVMQELIPGMDERFRSGDIDR